MNSWESCAIDVKDFVMNLLCETKEVLKEDFVGFYLHGSLAMGGFHPKNSDIDILIVTITPMAVQAKRELAQLLLKRSNKPFPIEMSCLNVKQLKNWVHPSPFDFHYSEYWRERYEADLDMGTNQYLNDHLKTDADLAAHITITTERGICVEGAPIVEVFPAIPHAHYVAAIMSDFEACLVDIEKDPVYCTLNLLRVLWYLQEGVISSKQEAGQWGLRSLPKGMTATIQKVIDRYSGEESSDDFEQGELLAVRDDIASSVKRLLNK